MIKNLSSIYFVIAILLLADRANAEDCPQAAEPAQAQEFAGAAFAEGQELIEQGNLAAALERFRCSYSQVPHPNTLYNMGECAEGLGQNEAALGFFREYLGRFPDAEDRGEVEARVARLEALVTPAEDQSSNQEPEEPTFVEPEPQPVRETRMSTGRLMAWVTLGTGAALTIAGIGVYAGSLSVNSDFEELRDNFDPNEQDQEEVNHELQDLSSKGKRLEIAGWVLMGVGLGTLVASILLFVIPDATVEVTASRRRHVSLGLSPLVGEANGLLLSGRF